MITITKVGSLVKIDGIEGKDNVYESISNFQGARMSADGTQLSLQIGEVNIDYKPLANFTIGGTVPTNAATVQTALATVFPSAAPATALPTEYPATYAAMQASISADPTTKRGFFVTADETNLDTDGAPQFSIYYYNGSEAKRLSISGNETIAGDKLFTGKISINGGFTNSYETDFWIAPAAKTNPSKGTQGLYIQHRVNGDLGGFVHDAGASELRLNGATNGGTAQNAHEASIVVTGGINSIPSINGILANFHTENAPTGTVTALALMRMSQVPALAAGFVITTLYGAFIESQIYGTNNYSLWIDGGNSVIKGQIVPPDVNSNALVVKGLVGQNSGAPIVRYITSGGSTFFQMFANGTGGMGGTVAGATFYVNNNLASTGTVAMRVRGISGQTADLLEFQNSSGTVLSSIAADGIVKTPKVRFTITTTPSSSADSIGTTGDMAYDDNYVYVKTSTGWKRSALSTF